MIGVVDEAAVVGVGAVDEVAVDEVGAVVEAVVDEVGAVVEVACAVVTDPVDVDDTAGLEEEVSSKEKSDIFKTTKNQEKERKKREGGKETNIYNSFHDNSRFFFPISNKK